MKRKVVEVSRQVMSCAAIQDPPVRIVLRRSRKVRTRIPGSMTIGLTGGGAVTLELRATLRTVSKHATQLALSLVSTGLTVVRTWREVLWWLPVCVAVVVVLVGTSKALLIAVVVALFVTIVCHRIR